MNSDDLSPAAQLAVVTVSSALEEAKTIQAEFLCGELSDLPASAPVTEEPWIDDVPLLLEADSDPDECLRLGPKDRGEHLALHRWNTGRLSWGDYAHHASNRAFQAAQEAARHHCPSVQIFGTSDGLNQLERGQAIRRCLRSTNPMVFVEPISGVDDFIAVHGDTHWASAAIAACGRGQIAVAMASGKTVAVTSWNRGFLSFDAAPWSPISKFTFTPELIRSRVMPLGKDITDPLWFLQFLSGLELDLIYGPSGNAMILNGVVLGGTGAAFLPSGYAWNAFVAPIAAAAGRTVICVNTQGRMSAEELHNRLLRSLITGERLPGLVIGRHDLVARQLVHGVRKFPA